MQKTKSRYTVIKIVAIVFSLIGGVHNLSGSFVELILPNFGPAQGSTGSFSNVFVGLLAIIFASATVIAAFYIMRKPRVAGWMLVIGAFGGLISIGIFYLISFAMTLIAGILCLIISKKLKR